MVFRSEGSLKSEMLSLARTSEYMKNTNVLSINKSQDSLDRKDSSNMIVIVVINPYSCFHLFILVQFIFYFWSFEVSVNILRNQK